MDKRVAEPDKIKTVLRQVQSEKLDAKHRAFHPFPARMPLELATNLVNELTTPSAVILDPMQGSGTAAIASRILGRPRIGTDIDPMAVVLEKWDTH